jgi:iron complex outermembrane receptor protein
MYKKTPLASAVSLAIAATTLGVSPQVLAQDAGAVEEIEEVIVTGSRIKRDGFSEAQPIDVVMTEVAVSRGIADVGSLLQTTTIAAGSSQVTSATSTEFVQNGGIGATTLSLRGLGPNRTLTLLNGRRAGPAGTRGGTSSFDLNVLPLAALERVEILKDGASSVYGSDAVAGVVNFITKKGDGATVDVYVSQPTDSGGEESRISASWGKTFQRGNFRITADYLKQEELARGDRDYFSCGEQYIFDPATGNRRDTIDPRTGSPWCSDQLWGHVWLYDYADPSNIPAAGSLLAQYDYDGDLGNYIPGYAPPADPNQLGTPPGFFPVRYDVPSDGVTNSDHPFQEAETLIPESEFTTLYADGEFDLTDNMTAYAEFLLSRRETKANGYRQYWTYIYNENSNFGAPPAPGAGDPLSVGWTGANWLSPTPITDHNDDMIEINYTRFVAGIKGDFTDNWSYDLAYQYSLSDGDYSSQQIYNDSIEDNWMPAFGGRGVGTCVGTTSSVNGLPCVDIPWLDPQFLAGDVPQDVRDFIFGFETGNTEYEQWSLEGYVTGTLFEMPAGPVGAVGGLHYREDSINDVPGELTLAGNAWGASTAGVTKGDDTTTAVFGELEFPLLVDTTMAKSLTLGLSGRYTDVDSYGDGSTYKANVDWQIVDSFRIRASQGTSFRTPALFELFLADETSFIRQSAVDPCQNWAQEAIDGTISQEVAANCQADGVAPDHQVAISATSISSGGLGLLEAETSTSRTLGFVWQPAFTELSVSVDYFDYDVEDEVAQLGGQVIVQQCYESDFFPNEPLCDLFERRAIDNGIDNIRDAFINIAAQTNRGYDIAAVWRTDIGAGTLTFDGQATVQTEASRELFAGNFEDTNGELGEPELVGRLYTYYDHGPWTLFWGANYIDSVSNIESYGGTTAVYRGEDVDVVLTAPSVTYHAFSLPRTFDDAGITAVVGVANAFDEKPPQITSRGILGGEVFTVGKSAFYSQYDWRGRRFYLNLTWSMQ